MGIVPDPFSTQPEGYTMLEICELEIVKSGELALPSSVLSENLPEIKSRSYSIISDPFAEDIENGIVESFWTTRSVWLAFTYNKFKNAKGE